MFIEMGETRQLPCHLNVLRDLLWDKWISVCAVEMKIYRVINFNFFYRYTRNLVDEGNGRFNLMVLCWGEGHGSAIHDHADAHCVMKILQGELCEVTTQIT